MLTTTRGRTVLAVKHAMAAVSLTLEANARLILLVCNTGPVAAPSARTGSCGIDQNVTFASGLLTAKPQPSIIDIDTGSLLRKRRGALEWVLPLEGGVEVTN